MLDYENEEKEYTAINVDFPVSEEIIIAKVNTEYNLSYQYTDQKRKMFEERIKQFMNISDQEKNKIYVRLIFAVIDTLMALYYADNINVKFTWNQFGDEEIAENIQALAKYDYKSMWLNKKKYQVQWDRLFFGVWLEVFEWRDEELKQPIVKCINPMYRLPDWNSDINDWPSFHWFEMIANEEDLSEENGYFNLDKLAQWVDENSLIRDYQQITREVRKFNDVTSISQWQYFVYHHYTIINWKKYLVTLWNNKSLIIRFQELPGNKFPVIARNYRPYRWDPYGISICDILSDKEQAIQLFMNLNRIKAEHQAWWDMFYYDTNVIDNIEEYMVPTMWPKMIPVRNMGQNPDPIREVQRWSIWQDAYNMPTILQAQAGLDVWLDAQTMWVWGASWVTATENQRLQRNANLKLILWSRIDGWAEKDFWEYWFMMYLEYFNWNDKKAFKLNTTFGWTYYNLSWKDIVTNIKFDIEVLTDSELNDMTEKEKMGFSLVANTILNNPQAPQYSKNYALRRLLNLNWIDKEESYVMVQITPEEEQAMLDVELLNRDEDVAPITNMNEDHYTYLCVYRRALDTKSKRKAIQARQMAYILSWQAQQMNIPQWMWEGQTNQISSSMIGQMNRPEQWASSLQDVTQQINA